MTDTLYSINCLVAATDFSTIGDAAVMRAALIAQNANKTLHLLHVVHPLDIYPELMLTLDTHVKDYQRLKQANGIESLDKLASQIRKEFGIKVVTASRIGRSHVQIAEYAKSESADLLVVGYGGENNILDTVMGSTAFRLLGSVTCPVLIVKNAKVAPYKEVIASVDLSSLSDDVVASALTIAPAAHVEVLHIFDLKQETLSREVGTSDADIKKYRDISLEHIDKELERLQSKQGSKRLSNMVVNGYLPESICSRVETLGADLIVLGKHNKSSLQEFVFGSVSKTVANMVDCDVFLT
ncbi:MAG TPA: universal stress protein [Methylophilaceae bacterium]|nr:universal stress protein [Methylophilaceae bacterium]